MAQAATDTGYVFYTCKACGTTTRRLYGADWQHEERPTCDLTVRRICAFVTCTCGNKMLVNACKRIMGRVSSSKKCNISCTGAQSDKCVCECGGQNHGRGHEYAA